MDERAFGELTRQIAAAPTRRRMLRTLGGALSAALLSGWRPAAPAPVAAQEVGEEKLCRPRKFPCRDKLDCCARKCVPGTIQGQPAMVCGCNKKGKDCIKGLGQSCCSGHCKKGKCS